MHDGRIHFMGRQMILPFLLCSNSISTGWIITKANCKGSFCTINSN